MPSSKNQKSKNRTLKKRTSSQKTSRIVLKLLEILNLIKLYHWKTRSYSQHKATDELYERLNKNIDRFVEVLLGKTQTRVRNMEKRMELFDLDNTADFKERVLAFRYYLTEMDMHLHKKTDSDLLSIRDEILADVNQFLYLLTFDK
jgi:hypothetical protein